MRAAAILLLVFSGLPLWGCSFPHPLQDDVTGLPLADIIRKITCEAHHGLHDRITEKKVALSKEDYRAAIRNLKELTKKVLKPVKSDTTALQKRRTALDFAFAANNREVDALQAALAAKPDEYSPELADRKARILVERAKILQGIVGLTRAIEKHNRDLDSAQLRINAATERTKKLTEGLARYYANSMALGFRFRITENNGATASASWKLPLLYNGIPGSWTVGGVISDTLERRTERVVNIVVGFADLDAMDCNDAPPQAETIRALRYPIKGAIGLGEVIDQYFELLDRAKRDQDVHRDPRDDEESKPKLLFGKADSYTDTINFTTKLTGSLSPSVMLNPTLRHQFTGSISPNVGREDFHQVSISLSQPSSDSADKESDKVQKIQIISEGSTPIR